MKRRNKIARKHLTRIISLVLVVLCTTSFSITTFASSNDDMTEPETEAATDAETSSMDETAEDAEEIPYAFL